MTHLSIENLMSIEDKLRNHQLPDIEYLIPSEKSEVEFYIKVRYEVISILNSKSGEKVLKANLSQFNQSFFKEDATIQFQQKANPKRKSYRMVAAATLLLIAGLSLQWYASQEYCSACIAEKFQTTIDLELRSEYNSNEDYLKFMASFERGEYPSLVAQLKADPALESNPTQLLMLANLYYKLKQYDLAIQTFTKLAALDEAYKPEYYFGVISSYMAQGEMVKANELNQKALIDKNLNSIYQFLKIEKALSHPLRRLTN